MGTTILNLLSGWLLRLDVVLALLCLFLLRGIASTAYRIFIYPYSASPLRALPGPRDHHFLIGHTLNQFRGSHPNEPYVSWMQKWPKAPLIRYFDFGNGDAVLVTSLAAHREILQDKAYSFTRPPFFVRLVRDIVGFGVGLAEGEDHKTQRRALAALFSTKNIEGFMPQLHNKASRFSDLLENCISNEGGMVNVVTLYSKIALEVIVLFATGVELDELSSGSCMPFESCYQELFEPDGLGMLLVAVNTVVPIRWLPIEANRRYKQAYKTLQSQIKAVIQKRIRDLDPRNTDTNLHKGERNQRENKDMLTWMVANKYYCNGDGKNGLESDGRWGEELMRDQIRTFLAAGHQTAADALVWATQLMVQHPSEGERLRAEVMGLLERCAPHPPSYHDIVGLPYLHNFTREVLRVQCPAISVPRAAAEDVVVQGVLLPKGTTVLMQPAVVHRNPTIWGPDCDEFRPDRWDNLETGSPAADSWAMAAFGHGPRVCIGRLLGMLEVKLILMEVVSRFRFHRLEGDERTTHEIKLANPGQMLRPAGGLMMRVERL